MDAKADVPVDARRDAHADAIFDTGLEVHVRPCSASGSSCLSTRCCANPTDICQAEGSDLVCVPPISPPADGGTCAFTSSSNLPGVSLAFVDPPCEFKWSYAVPLKAQFHYRLTVDQDLAGVHPMGDVLGHCDQPDSSGFIVRYDIKGGTQEYCRCDQGLCHGGIGINDAGIFTTAPAAGASDYTLSWDGNNWQGPSDDMAQEGGQFPPGQYTVTVTASGGWEANGAGWQNFTVTATLPITITP
ncbi:MAG TPA: hypothetical protein VMT03_11290 [Polyangia bacterium]|nr:hypothetical protein [Polyangia bacterium]